jgi:hypothetical protein
VPYYPIMIEANNQCSISTNMYDYLTILSHRASVNSIENVSGVLRNFMITKGIFCRWGQYQMYLFSYSIH